MLAPDPAARGLGFRFLLRLGRSFRSVTAVPGLEPDRRLGMEMVEGPTRGAVIYRASKRAQARWSASAIAAAQEFPLQGWDGSSAAPSPPTSTASPRWPRRADRRHAAISPAAPP